ncbi:GFA family protein [Yoonia sp. 208BN28-4]|uniref:GFA family protein n=1 Tax=Yoonia sp. 208BN28-4 TaxID=3126505 RepID=UPI0030A551EA
MADSTHKGKCHCGAVQFETTLTGGTSAPRRCNCSFCAMRGAVAFTAQLDQFTITKGDSNLTLYQFNTRTAEHYFCKTCRIYTHHRRRSNPNEYGVNAACLEGISPFDFPDVPVNEGQIHPSDDPDAPQIAGVLRYIKT